MKTDHSRELDQTDWKLLQALQENARLSYSELGRQVGLSTPAVIERIRKMESSGIIKGYRVELDSVALGYGITAFVRLESGAHQYTSVLPFAEAAPEIERCYYITGRESFIFKVNVTSISHLEAFIQQAAVFGNTATSIVMSTPIKDKFLPPPQ
jgi:Lrp/AsnC family leucine-responsive transcriptional regulator